MKVDLFEFARLGREAEGSVALEDLARIDMSERDGSLRWRAVGYREDGGGVREPSLHLDLAVDGAVPLVCQRCLLPMREPIDLDVHYLVAADEASAEALDEDDAFDVIAGAPDFDLAGLVEDEVILALPIAPRHAVCPVQADVAGHDDARPTPFAALAAWKKPGTLDA